MLDLVLSIIIWGIILGDILLGILVYSKNYRGLVNIIFFFFALFCALWALSLFFFQHPYFFSSEIWLRVCYVTVPVVLTLFVLFSIVLAQKQPKIPFIAIAISIATALPSIYLIVFGNLFLANVVHESWGYQQVLGPYYPVFGVWAISMCTWAVINFFRGYKKSTGIEKLRFKYLFLGMFFFAVIPLYLDVILPVLFGNSKYIWFSPISSIFLVGTISYSIIKHRLLDIRLAFQQFFVRTIQIILTSIILSLGAEIYWQFSNNPPRPGVFILAFALSVFIILIINRIQAVSEFIARKFLFQSVYDYQKTLKEFSHKLTSYLEMPKLVDIIINTLIQTMQLHRVAVLVKDFSTNHYKIQKTIGFNEENGISMVRDNFLTSYLEQNPKIIVSEEIMRLVEESHNPVEKERLQELYNHMEHIEAALIVPIMNNGKMISLIVLGHKISGDPYTVQDIELLNNISFQASIALENARLYQEVYFLNQELQMKIDEATIQLQAKNLDLEKANEGLKSLDKMKDQLIAVASHELRTPAANTQNYLWMTLTKPKPNTVLDPEDKERLQKSLSSIKNLIKLIGDILDVSKLEGGKMDVSLESIGYEGIINTVVEELRPRAQRKGLSLTISSAPSLPQAVLADSTKLREVLTNLITNAIKYTEHGGIIVGTEQKNQQIIFYIKDTGRGIAAENIPKLFQKFYREDTSLSASNPETGGTGLGLYITKQMLALMNGQIWLESIHGQGSIFYFSLPVTNTIVLPTTTSAKAFKGVFTREDYLKMKNVHGQSDGQGEVPASLPSFVVPESQNSKKKILLVEDDIDTKTFYSGFLSDKYEVDTAVDGMDGLAKLRLKHYDLVLLDVMMPVMNGVGFMQGLNQDPQLAKIPVILLTNLGEKETLSQCFDLGAKAMIMKSDVLPDQIIPVIEKELQNSTPLPQPQTPPQPPVNIE